MDGRAEKSLQVQGVCVLQVGVGKSGILRVSSGSDNSVNPAGNRWAPNALVLNKTQDESKMSQSAHAEIKKSWAHTAEQIPWRIGQGGVVGRAFHAKQTCGLAMESDNVLRCVRDPGVVIKEQFWYLHVIVSV